jgi:CheY-like chemotaxis protein
MRMDATKTILVVEDDDAFRRTIIAFLEDCGYEILQAANGREGLDLFLQKHPDAVLTDMRMPEMDGLAMTQRIKETRPATPVIAITGTASNEARQLILQAGAAECLPKPIHDLQILDDALRRVLPASPAA